jgi:hypothetical protein
MGKLIWYIGLFLLFDFALAHFGFIEQMVTVQILFGLIDSIITGIESLITSILSRLNPFGVIVWD